MAGGWRVGEVWRKGKEKCALAEIEKQIPALKVTHHPTTSIYEGGLCSNLAHSMLMWENSCCHFQRRKWHQAFRPKTVLSKRKSLKTVILLCSVVAKRSYWSLFSQFFCHIRGVNAAVLRNQKPSEPLQDDV